MCAPPGLRVPAARATKPPPDARQQHVNSRQYETAHMVQWVHVSGLRAQDKTLRNRRCMPFATSAAITSGAPPMSTQGHTGNCQPAHLQPPGQLHRQHVLVKCVALRLGAHLLVQGCHLRFGTASTQSYLAWHVNRIQHADVSVLAGLCCSVRACISSHLCTQHCAPSHSCARHCTINAILHLCSSWSHRCLRWLLLCCQL